MTAVAAGSAPLAAPRTTRSRSVTTPTNSSPSTTSSAPTFEAFIRPAASLSGRSTWTISGRRAMMSLTRSITAIRSITARPDSGTLRSVACAALGMLAAASGNSMQRLGRLRERACRRKIGERDDADETLIATHHRQTPKLQLRHVLGHVRGILVFETVLDLRAHGVAYLAVRSFALGNPANRDIAVGDHADQPIAFGTGNAPASMVFI